MAKISPTSPTTSTASGSEHTGGRVADAQARASATVGAPQSREHTPVPNGPAVLVDAGAEVDAEVSGALELGVDVGWLSPQSLSASRGGRDTFGRQTTNEPRSTTEASPAPTPSKSESPFVRMAADSAPRLVQERSLHVQAVGLEQCVDLSMESLSCLQALEVGLGGFSPALRKIGHGNLLLTSDSQALREKLAPMPKAEFAKLLSDVSRNAAKKKAHEDAIESLLKMAARFMAGERAQVAASIQAFVQWVLREAYLLQNLLLHDHAEKVRFLNAQKKRLREELQKAREAKNRWVSDAEESHHRLREPYPFRELGDDGVWRQPLMTEKDVEAWRAAAEAETNTGDAAVLGNYALFNSTESRLSDDQKQLLLRAMTYENANWIVQNGAPVVAAVRAMNREEFETYFIRPIQRGMPSFSGAFHDGLLSALLTADASTVTEVLLGLTPIQKLTLLDALRIDQWDGGGYVQGAGSEVAVLCIASGLNAEQMYEVCDAFRDAFTAVGGAVGRPVDGELTGRLAGELLEQVDETAPDARFERSHGGGAKVGDPKVLSTGAQLEGYIEQLEEQLNQSGEDSQLATADLQNALQVQQQVIQMLSNISKTFHDTAMAVVGTVGR